MFIRLHQRVPAHAPKGPGEPIAVNPDHIVAIHPADEGTMLASVSGFPIYVSDRYVDVLKLIRENEADRG